jgi:hypothetical protein
MSDPSTSLEHDEAQAILEALRQIQDSPELQAEARHNHKALLDRLNLSGIARTAVTLGIAAVVAANTSSNHLVHPMGWWSN